MRTQLLECESVDDMIELLTIETSKKLNKLFSKIGFLALDN